MSHTILYIEDNIAHYRLVQKLLGSKGFNVLGASRGYEGISIAKQQVPDLVLVDFNLPDITGTQVAHELRQDARFANTPIIAITANGIHANASRFIQDGFDGYIPKPITMHLLLDTVRDFLGVES